MIFVRLAGDRALNQATERSSSWVYLGKRTAFRRACESRLGLAWLVDITDDFRAITEELRQPYLDLVDEVGEMQRDIIGWYASTFAWKDPDSSDLFLLACYLEVVQRLAERDSGERPLTVFVDDEWLLAQCRANLGRTIDCDSRRPRRLHLVTRGLASRVRWLLRMLRMRAAYIRHRDRFATQPKGAVWIYSLPHPRCFSAAGRWNDPFFGALDQQLEDDGYTVRRLVPIDPVGEEQSVVERSSISYPMILAARVSDIVLSTCRIWRVRLPRTVNLLGRDVTCLAWREWWMDVGRASWPHQTLFHRVLCRAIKQETPHAIIYPYENQPWEKMIVAAALAAGVRTVGYQHSTVPRFLLPYFLGTRISSRALPDTILTTGRLQARLLEEGHTPPARLAVGGSLRYQHLGAKRHPVIPSEGRPRSVMVVTAHDEHLAAALMDSLDAAFSGGRDASGLTFHYRPHPTVPQADHPATAWMVEVKGDLAPQLRAFDAVVTTGSTVGLEACFEGLAVVKFQADGLIDLDPLDALPTTMYAPASRSGVRRAVEEAAARGRAPLRANEADLANELFSPVDKEAWRRAIGPIAQIK